MSSLETLSLAHTARCKLQLAADRPDRNLRFILGHAFTLDKLRLRLAEIEIEEDSEEDEYADDRAAPTERRVSFHASNRHSAGAGRKPSPPPDPIAHLDASSSDSSDGDEYDEVEEEEEEEDGSGGLSLRRFESGAAQPPRMIDDEEGSSGDEDEVEPKSPPSMLPSDADLKLITEGAGNKELVDAYQHVAGCPCHGERGAPAVSNVWEVPRNSSMGSHGPRVAVVQVEA